MQDLIYEMEAEQTDEDGFISEEEDDYHVDPAYLEYLRDVHQELIALVDEAGGELDMNVYSRFLFDELYIGRNVSPYYYELGLEIIYEE